MSKLRRHLGERVSDDMMAGPPVPAKSGGQGHGRMVQLRSNGALDVVFSSSKGSLGGIAPAPPPKKKAFLEVRKEDSDDSEGYQESDGDEGELVDEVDGKWEFLTTFKEMPLNRYSKKWIREKGGNRWVEEDVDHVLRQLRSL